MARAAPVKPAILAFSAAAAAALLAGEQRRPEPKLSTPAGPARGEALARRFCTSCHSFPPPGILPRSKWSGKVVEMVGFAVAGTGAPKPKELPLDIPVEEILAYYENAAPRELAEPDPWPEPSGGPVAFTRRPMTLAGGRAPAVANVRLLRLEPGGRMLVIAADMANGLVLRGVPARPEAGLEVIARVPNPCHTEPVDLDKDGVLDLVVADLGGVTPGDHRRGSVGWLRGKPGGSFEAQALAVGLPRIADVQPADFDGDGDLDLVVAAFGWRDLGSTLLLENRTRDWSTPVFVPRELDGRQGGIHVPVADLDKDGRPDFVGLLSQHHETVVAFFNQGKGAFRPTTVYTAPHPGWGSSGLELTDLDGDGDLDVLMTNGDMFDEFLLKPYHGISWLENRGTFPFTERVLAPLYGVHRARAVDLDGDGDLDVVASTLIPGMAAHGRPLPSLVWLEQVAPGRFARHTLEKGGYHATLDVGDVDGDGDVDVVTGTFQVEGQGTPAWVEVWEQR
jgi:hypothetical protein